MKKSLLALAVVSAIAAAPAMADDGVSTNFSLTTNYKYRGQDQTDNKPAIQGGFDYSLGGFYIGNWNSSIGFTDAGIEMDVYAGYKGEFGSVGYDVGILQYVYPGASDANTTELYGGLSFGMFSAKYSHTVSKRYFGLDKGRNTGYLDLGASFPVSDALTLEAHVGFTNIDSDADAKDYTDFKLGASFDLGSGFTLGGHVVGANKRSFYGDINKTRFILTLTKSM
jgi:uncharacterized protein (TIGR02001 family)